MTVAGLSRGQPAALASGSDPKWDAAGKLLQERQIPSKDHVLLQENVATALSHSGPRFANKLQRELSQPYTDGEVMEHLEEMQEDLKDCLASMASIPHRVYVHGSYSRGRLGAASDLDVLVELDRSAPQKDLDLLRRSSSDDGPTLFPLFADDLNYNRALFLVNGSSREIDPAQLQRPGYLQEVYQEELVDRGIVRDSEGTFHKVAPAPDREEIDPVFARVLNAFWGEEKTLDDKWETLYSQGWKARAMRTGFRVVGALSALPGVGWLVHKVVDALIPQDHQSKR